MMYYHCRPLKYIQYGKIQPPPIEIIDDDFKHCYRWLGHYCGYNPQIWLSRSTSQLTGYKNKHSKKEDFVMFGFDVIKGFNVDFEAWELFIHSIFSFVSRKNAFDIEKLNNYIFQEIQSFVDDSEEDEDDFFERYRGLSFDQILNNILFVENDQVVVPSLNLKSAKEIFVRTEKVKKKLRKMGFIEDRIKIMPNKLNTY